MRKDPDNPYQTPERLALNAVNADRRAAYFEGRQRRRDDAFSVAAAAANLEGVDSNWPRCFMELASLSCDWGKVLAGTSCADALGREDLKQVRKILHSVRY